MRLMKAEQLALQFQLNAEQREKLFAKVNAEWEAEQNGKAKT